MQGPLNIELMNQLKDILFRLQKGEPEQTVKKDFVQQFKDSSAVDILLILQGLKSGDYGITLEDIRTFLPIYQRAADDSILNKDWPEAQYQGHPVQVFTEENSFFENCMSRLSILLTSLKENTQEENMLNKLIEEMERLGDFYRHYHRKEKLFFPILERYGHYTCGRIMWAEDDRVRTLYKGTKRLMEKLPDLDFQYVKEAYDSFEKACRDMIFQEETFLLPIVLSIFREEDWLAIAKESKAFGFAVNPKAAWIPDSKLSKDTEETAEQKDESSYPEHLRFGGGYLTLKEANNILNNLPVEITFVDKSGIFKYFNEICEASEMMFVRTPLSIGRNVANCHPPKNLKKVMHLIRALKTKKRSSESMWFRKKNQFIHVTYKGVFDDDGEYLGILEYVQDIQPFLDLPRDVKKELS